MYLGNSESTRAEIPASDLTTHCVVLGRTGSGKSGLTIALVEEAAKSGASVLVLDPKGDLANLALPLVTPEEWKVWADEEARLRHGEGLGQSNLSFDSVKSWREKVKVKLFSPGKVGAGANLVNLFPRFAPPPINTRGSWKTKASREVLSVLTSVAGINDAGDPAVVYLTSLIVRFWDVGQSLPIDSWSTILTTPPGDLTHIGGMALEQFFPKSKRLNLARTLIGFQHQSDRWMNGERLNLHEICTKPTVAVFTMRHLMEEDRQFFAGRLLDQVVQFMFETEASDKLKLLVVLDEARGYLPPYPQNPPTKGPICTILAQGRAQGIGMVVGTQNPMDLDYKALSNVGTWFVGRLRKRDCARDLMTELSSRGIEPEDVADVPQRNFLLLDKRGDHKRFETRWCLNYLFGPMSGQQLEQLSDPRVKLSERKISPEPISSPQIKVFKPEPGPKPPTILLEEKPVQRCCDETGWPLMVEEVKVQKPVSENWIVNLHDSKQASLVEQSCFAIMAVLFFAGVSGTLIGLLALILRLAIWASR